MENQVDSPSARCSENYYMEISIIAAVAANGAIGYRGQLLYHITEDMNRFKQLTWGHTIIMGHNTYKSLPCGALPGRRNIVLSRHVASLPDCEVYPSLEQALATCCSEEQVFIIGGAQVYCEAMPLANRLYLTEIKKVPAHADTFFPELAARFKLVSRQQHDGYCFALYQSY